MQTCPHPVNLEFLLHPCQFYLDFSDFFSNFFESTTDISYFLPQKHCSLFVLSSVRQQHDLFTVRQLTSM